MLKYMPIAGSILLTILILYIVVWSFIGSRRKIGDALYGRIADNPVDVLIRAGVLNADDKLVQAWRDYLDEPVGEPPEPIFYHSRHPAPHPDASAEHDHPWGDVLGYPYSAPEVTSDEGEPLTAPPQPNVGGEGNPDYAGPHYEVEHDRFVPYDVLRDPIPGAAVHIVGNAACVGPLEDEGARGHADPGREKDES